MPFNLRDLAALVASDSVTLWFYSTSDTRATVLAPGYFSTVADRLDAGHIIICRAADALSFLPVRANGAVGNGLVLDAYAAPLSLTTSAAQVIETSMSTTPVTRTLSLGAIPAGITVGRTFSVSASVTGAVSSVSFTLLDGSGTALDVRVAIPVAGNAGVTFTAPSAGTGFRIRAADTDEPAASMLSSSFVISAPFAILLESGGSLLTESGAELVQ